MVEAFFSSNNIPQRLCKACGKCCTMAVCRYSFEELNEFSKCEESEAKDFLDAFIPYDNLDEPRKISSEYVDLMVEKFKEQGLYQEGKPIFLHCRYINPDNTCSIYENRYGWCRRMPNHGWTVVPVGCGFEGWQFGVREQVKHTIRQLKEYIFEYETLYGVDGFIESQNTTVKELKEKINQKIQGFARFGSKDW